ncbi:DUF6777 domain-containing protein [Streptomyces sp. NPDC046716]|uniref:DUF6777 domain-containing protein n=1 Tax=Streptomyces sp. NPDC046716 TaxID=3157093 RepID=UPI00340BA1AB
MRARIRTRTYVTALGISAALLLAGCSGDGAKNSADGKSELFMQPVAAQGPDPFTDSTATADASSPPVTRTPQPSPTGTPSATQQGAREISGATPGLYGGTHALGSCDVEKQVRFLTADQAKAGAFAEASGISRADVPAFLRGLTPVVLRADTRVTNHGYRDGRATTFQSVLQSGTAVMVDGRGQPRVRCACGNPVRPPVALKGSPSRQGQTWSGYEPTRVVVVTPAPTVIQNITIVNVVNNTWIERKIGDDGHKDHVVPPPSPTRTPTLTPSTSPSDSPSDSPTPSTTSPSASTSESESATDTGTPSETTSSTACPTATATDSSGNPSPSPWPSGCPTPTPESSEPTGSGTDVSPDDSSDVPTGDSPDVDEPSDTAGDTADTGTTDEDTGPRAVPDTPDQSDGGGLIPDASDGVSP